MEKSTAGTNKKSPDGLSHPNQNTIIIIIIIINKIWEYFIRWKKHNEIQLTKNKMDLNIRKMTDHPPSPAHARQTAMCHHVYLLQNELHMHALLIRIFSAACQQRKKHKNLNLVCTIQIGIRN